MSKKNKLKNDNLGIIKGVCVDYSSEGKGIIKDNNIPVFVDNLLLGEEAEVMINYKKPDMMFGRVLKINKVSPDRIQPMCKVCTSCGGCCFQTLNYKAQLDYKKKKVSECFKRIGKMTVHVEDTVGMEYPYFYRNKIQMPLGLSQKGNIISGFYKAKTHEIVPIEKCYIENEEAGNILTVIKDLMKKMKIKPYNEDTRDGVIRHILIRTGYYTKQIMVTLVTNADSFPGRGNFVKELHKQCPQITTIVQNINRRDTNVILGEKENVLMGKGFIEDSLLGVKFQISSKSFYQINPTQTEKLYSLAIEKASLTGQEKILDAYCGIGTIGLIASSKAKEVVSVEIVEDAIKDAKKNARLNNINNVSFVCDDASNFMVEQAKNNVKYDVVFIDPPRKGSDERFLNSLKKLRPTKVVYVSCDPATLARDIKFLSDMYVPTSVTPVDMFPMTFHVETVVSLVLKPQSFKSNSRYGEDFKTLKENNKKKVSRNICDIHEDGA